MRLTKHERAEFARLCAPVLRLPDVRRMKDFLQHGNTTTYAHSLAVAQRSYWLCRRLPFRFAMKSVVRGALLHDLYLYDWHEDDPSHRLHGFHHPRRALDNASRLFLLSRTEKNIIGSHMWPLLPHRIPRCREAVVVCLADKYCTLSEMLHGRKKRA